MSEAININPFNGGGGGGGSITVANNVEKDNYNPVSSDAVYRYVNNRLEAFGRYWIEENSTPVAAGYIGSAERGRDFIKWLELGRYLVTDDRIFKKLWAGNSQKYDNGSIMGGAAALDGTEGQCMWCWCQFYYGYWEEELNNQHYTFEVVSKNPLFEGHRLIPIPRGGVSWLSAGVWDATTGKLCSLISDDANYRGGSGSALSAATYTSLDNTMKQLTMLGMPRTEKSTTQFGAAARLRGEGWEANWFVAEAVVEILMRLYFGNRNIQAAFDATSDSVALHRGGLGSGVTNMPDWQHYNGYHPLIPNEFSILDADNNDIGDFTGVKNYAILNKDSKTVYSAPVPFFAGLMNPFGHLYKGVRGLIIDIAENGTSDVYIAPSMADTYDATTVADKVLAGHMARTSGYAKKLILNKLAMLPAQVGASVSTYYADYLYTDPANYHGLKVRLAGGSAAYGTGAGAAYSNTYYAASYSYANFSAPLCVFAEDPVVE
ncbi:MAG: hypothetical protein IJL04_01150 [Bacteroidales bacterium]|nr:hypothetical protein [Bacteroidales bacterium]